MAETITAADDLDLVALADLIHWMNAQKRGAPGKMPWRHRAARQQLEVMGVQFLQRVPRGKLYFRLSQLREECPKLADAFRPGAVERAAEQRA